MQPLNSPEQPAASRPGHRQRPQLMTVARVLAVFTGTLCASASFGCGGSTTAPSASADEPSKTWPEGPVVAWVKPVDDFDGQLKKAPDRKVGTEEKVVPVSFETAIGSKQRSEAQKRFAKLVADMGTRRQVIKVDGQEFPVPTAGSNGEIDPQPPRVGYKLEKDHFATFTYESKVIARSIEETLFAVNDANIYPGRVFLANPYLQNGEVNEVNVSSEVWAPVKVAIYSPTLKTNESGKLFDTPTAYGTPANEAGRLQQFKQVQAQLIRGVNNVGAWKELTQTTFSQSHLGLQASLRVSGGWGSVAASAKYDENQENATVYMLLTQESYRIAVDDAETAAGWIASDPRPDDLAKLGDLKSPLLYVSEVIYGRVILVTATSQLSSDDLKIALSGDAKVWKQRIELGGKYDKESKLAATTFNILSYGGTAQPGAYLKFEEYGKELTRLKTAELTTASAMPIAYKACWLADKSPAAWVGVTPLRTYKVVRDPISYTVKVKDYNVKDTHCTQEVEVGRHWATRRPITDTRPADGSMVIAARDVRKEYKDDYKVESYVIRTGGNRQHTPNFTLINRQPVPELSEDKKFDLRIRQGENGDPKTWDDLKSNGAAYKEHSIEVSVQELLNAESKEKLHTIDFDDGNKVTILIRINAPVVPKLGEPPPLRKPETASSK